MSCENKKKNSQICSCTYPGCSRKGLCCECLQYHLSNQEIPGCFFPPQAEKTYNRSRDYFISVCQSQ
ncbi:MAG: DUF6485 family protein [Candidatus Omnitrophota bacterium]